MCNQFFSIEDSFLKVNHAIIMCFKEKQRCCKNSFYLVEEWFYSANIGVIADDSLLEANCAIVIYLSNEEWNHELYFVFRMFLTLD